MTPTSTTAANLSTHDDQHCPISTCPGASNTDQWILCDHCQKWYHTACVAVVIIPEEEWLCPTCVISVTSSQSQVTPSSLNTTTTTKKKHIIATTQYWLKSNLVEDPLGLIPKSEIVARYAHHIQTSGEGRVVDATVGKYILQLFPSTKFSRPPTRGAANAYIGIRWKDQPPLLPHAPRNWGAELSQLKNTVPTLRRVPKGARMEVAKALAKIIEEVTTTNSEESWFKLFSFPYAVVPVPTKSDKVKNLTTWVKSRVLQWFVTPSRPRPQFAKPSRPQETIAKKVEAKLADGDVRGAIRLLTSDDTIAPNNQETLDALITKHPPHPEPTYFPNAPDKAEVLAPVDPKEVLIAISSFAPGSAGGLDSLRPQILKDLVISENGEPATNLLNAMLKFLDLVLRGDVPKSICPIFFGASMTALRKKTGGIRPVAVGNTWRRLISKIAVARMSSTLVEIFSPHQLGVGIKGGAEAAAHAARIYWNYSHDSPKAFLKLDFRNAFNEIRRDTLLQIIREKFPNFYRFVSQAYSSPSEIFFAGTPISSLCGVQQGDPLGPALYALVIQPIVDLIDTELNMWYLDDSTIADSPEKVLMAMQTITRMGTEVGLHLNTTKCEVGILGVVDDQTRDEIFELFRSTAPGIQKISPESAMLLGVPLTDEAIPTILGAKTEEMEKISTRLLKLSSHSAFFLLRASISTPRLIYFLRCAPTWRRFDALTLYDAKLKNAMEGIINCSLSPQSWLQSSLPVNKGGLGVRHAIDVAIPCFLASIYSSLPLAERLLPPHLHGIDTAIQEGEERWKSLGSSPLPPLEIRGIQAIWEIPQQEGVINHLTTNATTLEDKARYHAMSQPNVGAWLNAIPSPQLGTHLPNETFRIAAALRLRCDICQPHKCSFGEQVSTKGYHGLSCKNSAGRHSRHAAANDVIARALRSAGVPIIKEPAGCAREDGKRPDGLTLIPWARGKSVVWDFTCSDTFAPSYLPQTSIRPGVAAEKAEDRKKKRYEQLMDSFLFVPIAIETTGIWGKDGLSFIKEIGSRITNITEEKRATSFLLQRMSITVQRGNVASILGSLPKGHKLEEIFML
ncbi:Retrovirus-related Pol polyprotein from type-2 retrotransposable element R2DM [Folsomia candida]|uniref:Retrovirus-related Pol polyprotein from type-2 retrotransposable element R2DM n=1 Tax=Folsomia candida TaxID=158441 RepID=A0A226ENY2_FOLCA|nr:Retrovirus-related Pol polyprotein from type-2 retrotransposable element R2DM [Folsomia candida]